MRKDDFVYVRHMLDMACKALTHVQGKTRAAFDGDELLRLALTHLIQMIGEAARHVSREFQDAHPEVPWPLIIGMRHKVVHDYLDVDENVVWDTATGDLSTLIEKLERIVPPAADPPK